MGVKTAERVGGDAPDGTGRVVKFVIVIAPLSAPQVCVPPLNGVAHPLAGRVFNAVRRHGNAPVGLWKIVDSLANAENPDSRAQRRCWRLRYLGAVRELVRFKVLFRHGGQIATSNFATRPRSKSRWSLSPSVASSPTKNGGSNPVVPVPTMEPNRPQAAKTELVGASKSTPTCVPEPKSATPTPAQITEAARALAQRQRKMKRPWTGYLHGERVKRGSLVRVPTGEVLPVYLVLRGKILVVLPDEPRYADRIFERYDASQVCRVKLQAAQLLGGAKPRAGRKRGRPRTVVMVTPSSTPTTAGAAA